MTRAELAEAANAYAESELGAELRLDDRAIKRYENGLVQWPRAPHRQALRAVLEADSDDELGFVPSPRGTATNGRLALPVPEPSFAGVAGEAVVLLEQVRDLSGPATVSEADLAHLRATADLLTSWSYAHGGAAMRATVSAQVTHAINLLTADCPPRLHRDRLVAVGQLCVAVAAQLFDAHRHVLAGRLFDFATSCAEEAGDWHLRAKALSWRARQAVWLDDPDAGLTYAQLGLVRADRLSATERAMLHTAIARAHARRGDATATLSAVAAADDEFSHADPAEDPSWMAYYDAAQHHGDTGTALYELAIHGHHLEEAINRLTAAVGGHTDDYRRSRAFSGYKLATLTMLTGDPAQAAVIALAAVQDATDVASRRLDRTASELVTASQAHRNNSDVAHLLEYLNDRLEPRDQHR